MKGFRLSPAIPVVLVLTLQCCWTAGCSTPKPNPKREIVAPDPLVKARKEKDQAFKFGPDSPIPEEDRARFQGLSYYNVDPAYRFRVTLHRYPRPEPLRMGTNTEEIRQGLRYGYFEFEVQGQVCRLQVYRMMDDPGTGKASLFIPFRDATSGRETYGGGRYIDLDENTSGTYDLDLNLAYNPSCVYGKNYSCPLPPRENTLPVPILAGEKNYSLQE